MADDASLVTRALAGEREAAGEIYDRYVPLVRAILLDATGSLSEANDLVQEVFLKALGSLDSLRDRSYLCGWLVTIARRQGVEFRRRRALHRLRFTTFNHDIARQEATPSDDVEAVRQAIRQLPPRERLAVHIHYLCGEPVEAARQALGLSSSGFYKLLERAKGRLHKTLEKMESKR